MEVGESAAAAGSRNPRRSFHDRDLNTEELSGDIPIEMDDEIDELDTNTNTNPNTDINPNTGTNTDTEGTYDGVPEVGMVFETHQEVNRFYRKYAKRIGFGVSIRRSSFTKEGTCLYLELMCCKGGRRRSEAKFRRRASAVTNCPAKIRVKLWGDGLLHLELANLAHNHPVSPSMAQYLSQYKRLPGSEKRRLRTSGGRVLPPEEPSRMPVDRLGMLEELLFGETDQHGSFVERGRLRLGQGDAEALRIFVTRMQAKNPNFFNVMDLDEEGCLRGVFWADARSRAAYTYFSDVVQLDTSCVTSRYELPLVLFLGVNHHGQSVLLGCALLSDETAESYSWLLKAFIACMSGYVPGAVITDYCKNIQSAVSEVIPSVRHRICLFQIMKRVTERLGGLAEYRGVNKAMQKAIFDSLSVEDFEAEWRQMVEIYRLHGDEWLGLLYDNRYYWVPVFIRDTFWAGMSMTQRTDTVGFFFEGFVDSKTSIKQFLSKYESALQSNYEKEAQADFETFHKRRPAVSKFYMEEQLSKVYTLNIFKLFQDEIENIMYCQASLVNIEGLVSTFNVKECIFLEDGKRTVNKDFSVSYDSEGKNVNCICGYFQFKGILCRHSLSVCKLQQVHEIPPQYVLDRWKKEFKRLHVMNRESDDFVANNRVDRYDYLSMRCLQLVEVGVLSDKYRLALKLVREMERFLLSDLTHDDTQPRIKPRVMKLSKVIKNRNIIMAGKSRVSEKGDDDTRLDAQPSQQKDCQDTSGKQISQEKDKGGANRSSVPTEMPMNGQLSGRPSIVYMFPGGFDPQNFGNNAPNPIMPWMYQHMFQSPNGNTGQISVQPTMKKRRINRSRKTVDKKAEEPNGGVPITTQG